MSKEKHFPPVHAKGEFHCPHCGVFAKQRWAHFVAGKDLYTRKNQYEQVTYQSRIYNLTKIDGNLPESWTLSACEHCNDLAMWSERTMIYPTVTLVEQPNKDLDQDIQEDYLEAANILNESPRASAALLRLALQKLCKQLGQKGKNINDDIGELVKNGLNPTIQKSLDALRITGNNGVHPGEINLTEEPERVIKLFKLINFIAEKMLTEPNEISVFYDDLPENATDAVKKRDS